MDRSTMTATTVERRHLLDRSRATHRESLVWVVPAAADDLTTFAYTWVDARGMAGAAIAVFGSSLDEQIFEKYDGIQVPETAEFDAWSVGPLSMHLDASGTRSSLVFRGDLAQLELDFEGFHAPYAYGSHPDGCPSFFADDRVEQSGKATGTLRLANRELGLDTPAQRDHSWGERDWGAMHHMKWVNALAPGGDAVHAVEIFAFGKRWLRGYVHREEVLSPLSDMNLSYQLDAGMLHTAMNGEFRDGLGRVTEVAFTDGGPHFEWDVNPRLTIRDTAMATRMDGIPGVGYVDMSWGPEYFSYNASRLGTTRGIEV